MITLTAIIYEDNFRDFMKEKCWFFNFNHEKITKKKLLINNLFSVDEFNYLVDELRQTNNFDIIYSKDYETLAIERFKIDMNVSEYQKNNYYKYTIAHLINILTIDTPYIFNVSSDCINDININDEYIEKTLEVLLKTNHVITSPSCNTIWNNNTQKQDRGYIIPSYISCPGEWEHILCDKLSIYDDEINNFWFSPSFSDHVWIGDIKKLLSVDFNILDSNVPHVPYGYGSFEHRLTSYFIFKSAVSRLIYKDLSVYYRHY